MDDASEDLVTRYFAATAQAALDAAEAALLARSRGPVEHSHSVVPGHHGEAAWLGGLRPVPRGIRSAELFGESPEHRRVRLAHLVLPHPIAHPGGGTTRVVPVIGPDLRPPREADGVLAEPPCDALYRELATQADLAARIDHAGLARPDELLAELLAAMAATLARLAAGWPTRTWDAWTAADAASVRTPREPPLQRRIVDKPELLAIRMFADTCVLAFPAALVIARLRDGKVLRTLDTRNAELLAVPTPDLALFRAELETGETFDLRAAAMQDDDAGDLDLSHLPTSVPLTVSRIFALDLRERSWVTPSTRHTTPRVWFRETLERSHLVDDRGRTRILREVVDYPVIAAFTPDHRFVWVEDKHSQGGVFRTRDAALVGMRREHDDLAGLPRLTAAGALATTRRGWFAARQTATAVVRTPRGTWRALAAGVVHDNWRPFLTLDGAARLAAFDPDGTRLAISDGKTLRVIDVAATPRELVRWPLAPHAASTRPLHTR